MLAPTHFRGLLSAATNSTAKVANATTDDNTSKPASACSALETLLRAARAVCAGVYGALCGALDRVTELFKTSCSADSTASPRVAAPTPASPPSAMATTTTTTATAATTATATSVRSAPRRRSAPLRPLSIREREVARERRDLAAARAPPPPPPQEQLDREALMFPASRPRHDYDAVVVDGAPSVITSAPDVAPVFDDLLLPPYLAALPPAAVREDLQQYARWPSLQASLAQDRINLAVVRARGSAPPTTDNSVQCGCGWCPNETAAYPLCAAVTMRRTMRSFGRRASTSHAGDAARRQSATGHRRDTAAAAVMAGGRARA